MITEPDSDLQRLWARDTEDLGALEGFFSFLFSFHYMVLASFFVVDKVILRDDDDYKYITHQRDPINLGKYT